MLEVITYGGTVTRLLVPRRDGRLDDVVLGFDNLNAYLSGRQYFGAIIGRVAGRITGGQFQLDGRTYPLAKSDPPNHVHGGVEGFDKKIWTAVPEPRIDGAPSLRLTYVSPDGEEGYPGTVRVSVIYTVTADNGFEIITEAATDRATPFSLTHHSYFNLAGEDSGSIADHELQIHADDCVSTDAGMTLLGKWVAVAGKENDFNSPRVLGKVIGELFKSHGDLYLIRKSATEREAHSLVKAGKVTHRGSGRALTVYTTEEYLQLYVGVSIPPNLAGKSGQSYVPHAGLCLECEGYPDGANVPAMGDIILRPGQTHRQATIYSFTTV